MALLMSADGLAGELEDFERAGDAIEIVDADAARGCWIDFAQTIVEMRNSVLVGCLREAGADFGRSGGPAEDSATQCAQIKAAATDDQHAPSARDDFIDSFACESRESCDIEGFV